MLGGCTFTFIIINIQRKTLTKKLKDGEFRLFEGLLKKEDNL